MIETKFAESLGTGEGASKGRTVLCGDVERALFEEVIGEQGVREHTEDEDARENSEVDVLSDEDEGGGGGVALPAKPSHRFTPIGTTANGTGNPREQGLLRAQKREKVRQAARRLIAFGLPPRAPEDRLSADGSTVLKGPKQVEAVQGGRVVESSFAKGEFGIRFAT